MIKYVTYKKRKFPYFTYFFETNQTFGMTSFKVKHTRSQTGQAEYVPLPITLLAINKSKNLYCNRN